MLFPQNIPFLKEVTAADMSDFHAIFQDDHAHSRAFPAPLTLQGLLPKGSFGPSQLIITSLERSVGQTLAPKIPQ